MVNSFEKLTVEIPSESILVKEAYCPKGHSLIEPRHPMSGYPSIKLFAISENGNSGEIFLNALYGNFDVDSTFPLKEGEVFELYCPVCKIDLRLHDERCSFCGALIFQLKLPRGGLVEACSRKGCHNHRLKLIDLSVQFAKLFENEIKPRY